MHVLPVESVMMDYILPLGLGLVVVAFVVFNLVRTQKK